MTPLTKEQADALADIFIAKARSMYANADYCRSVKNHAKARSYIASGEEWESISNGFRAGRFTNLALPTPPETGQ